MQTAYVETYALKTNSCFLRYQQNGPSAGAICHSPPTRCNCPNSSLTPWCTPVISTATNKQPVWNQELSCRRELFGYTLIYRQKRELMGACKSVLHETPINIGVSVLHKKTPQHHDWTGSCNCIYRDACCHVQIACCCYQRY